MAGILIVDDDKLQREVLRISLLRKKHTIFEASDGREAIDHFKPQVTDLVITDLIMPEEEGLRVILKLRELKPGLKVIAISGGGIAGPGNYLEVASALGADAVFSKPFPVNQLLSTVDKLLKGEQPK